MNTDIFLCRLPIREFQDGSFSVLTGDIWTSSLNRPRLSAFVRVLLGDLPEKCPAQKSCRVIE